MNARGSCTRVLLALMTAGLVIALVGCSDDTGTGTCSLPKIKCGSDCINPTSDNNNCGACNTKCDTTAGFSCSASKCVCGGGLSECSGKCVDFTKDAANCGTCGNACKSGEICDLGKCTTSGSCVAPRKICDGACIDPQSDNANCGDCAKKCDATNGFTCTAGTCKCTGTLTDCSGKCVNTAQDIANCGACGTACTAGQVCDNGKCSSTPCASPKIVCSGACIDPQSDNNNCGVCGTVCATANGLICTAGACKCVGTLTNCSGTCADTNNDVNNCGACGTKCTTGQTCQAGVCKSSACPTGQTLCGTICVTLTSDNNNCGTCGVACTGGKTCVAGACACPTGQTDCSGTCKNTNTDPTACGSCTTVCPTGQTCSGTPPTCKTVCPTGQQACGSPPTCVTVATDNNNCGACGVACTGGKTCSGGVCNCPTGETSCTGTCYNLQTNSAHCGTCTTACTATQICNAGTCTSAPVISVTASCAQTTVSIGGTTQCSASAVLQGGATVPVTTLAQTTWGSQNDTTNPGGCGTTALGSVSNTAPNKGKYTASLTAPTTLGCRSQVWADYQGPSAVIKSNLVNITIKDKAVLGASIVPANATVIALDGLRVDFRVFLQYDNGTKEALPAPAGSNTITWTNSNPNVAVGGAWSGTTSEVYSNTANLAVGTTNIGATVVFNGTTYNLATNFTVVAAPISSLAISPANPTAIPIGGKAAFQAIATLGTATWDVTYIPTTLDVNSPFRCVVTGCTTTWDRAVGTAPLDFTQDPSIYFDTTDGKYYQRYTGATVTTGTPDRVTAAFNGITANANLSVTGATLSKCYVTVDLKTTPPTNPPTAAELLDGDVFPMGINNYQVQAWGLLTNDTWTDITSQVAWSSSASTVAQVDNAAGAKGQLDTLAAGTAVITADPTAVKAGVANCTASITVQTANACQVYVTPQFRNDKVNEYRRAYRLAGAAPTQHPGGDGPGLTADTAIRPVLPNEAGFAQRFIATAYYCTVACNTLASWPSMVPTTTPAGCHPIDVTSSASWSTATGQTPPKPTGLSYSGTAGVFNTVVDNTAGNESRTDIVKATIPVSQGSATTISGSALAMVCGKRAAGTAKLYSLFTDTTYNMNPGSVAIGLDTRYYLVEQFKLTTGTCAPVAPTTGWCFGSTCTNGFGGWATAFTADGYLLNISEEGLNWTVDPPAIGTASNTANSRGGIHGATAGTATVRASYSVETAELGITVTGAVVQSCTVTPTSGTMQHLAGFPETLQFKVTATMSSGPAQDYTANASTTYDAWSTAIGTNPATCAAFMTTPKGRLQTTGGACDAYIVAKIGSIICTPCITADGTGCPANTARPKITITASTVTGYFFQDRGKTCLDPVTAPITLSPKTRAWIKGCIQYSNGIILEDTTGVANLSSNQPTLVSVAPDGYYARLQYVAAGNATITGQRTFGTQVFNPTIAATGTASAISSVAISAINTNAAAGCNALAPTGVTYEFCELGASGQDYRVIGTRADATTQDLTWMATFSVAAVPGVATCTGTAAFTKGDNPPTPGNILSLCNPPAGGCALNASALVTFTDATSMSTAANSATVRVFENLPNGFSVMATPASVSGAGKVVRLTAKTSVVVGTQAFQMDSTRASSFEIDAPQAGWLYNYPGPANGCPGYFQDYRTAYTGYVLSRAVTAATTVGVGGTWAPINNWLNVTSFVVNP